MSNRVSIEEGVAGKMEKHHRARAGQREEARQQLHQKAQAQVLRQAVRPVFENWEKGGALQQMLSHTSFHLAI